MERHLVQPTCQSLQQSSRGRSDMYPIPRLDFGRISKTFPSPLSDCYYGQLYSSSSTRSHLQTTTPGSWLNSRTMNRRSHGISDILYRTTPAASYCRSPTPPQSAVYGNTCDISLRSSGNLQTFPSF